jgi:hypothetical protein
MHAPDGPHQNRAAQLLGGLLRLAQHSPRQQFPKMRINAVPGKGWLRRTWGHIQYFSRADYPV